MKDFLQTARVFKKNPLEFFKFPPRKISDYTLAINGIAKGSVAPSFSDGLVAPCYATAWHHYRAPDRAHLLLTRC